MEITWNKDTCFRLKGKDAVVVINPQEQSGKLKGDIVMTSLSETAAVDGASKTFDWPGEYEMKDVLINAFRAWTKPKKEDGENDGEETLIFRFAIDGIRVCHLGELGHSLTSELVDHIGDVDVLMIKIGEGANLDKHKALEVIESIEPRIVIPMGGNGLVAALKDLGIEGAEQEEKLSIKGRSSLPTDQMKYIVLAS